jgi:protein SCO1/2
MVKIVFLFEDAVDSVAFFCNNRVYFGVRSLIRVTGSIALFFYIFLFMLSAHADPGEDLKTVEVKLQDVEIVDQDGRKLRFKSDIVGGKVVVLIPFYTTCTTAYPILIYTFTRLQNSLGDRLGKEVVLVSVSVDPKTDIPVRLKAFARRQKARPGWIFLAGERDNLTKILLGVGILSSQNLDDHNHTPFTVVGGEGRDWKRFYGFPSPELLNSHIQNLLVSGK